LQCCFLTELYLGFAGIEATGEVLIERLRSSPGEATLFLVVDPDLGFRWGKLSNTSRDSAIFSFLSRGLGSTISRAHVAHVFSINQFLLVLLDDIVDIVIRLVKDTPAIIAYSIYIIAARTDILVIIVQLSDFQLFLFFVFFILLVFLFLLFFFVIGNN
jgi:hypothetical protein